MSGQTLLNPDQITFSQNVAARTGLNFEALCAWCLAEEPSTRSPELQGHNWLNLLNKSAGRTTHGFSGVPIVGFTDAGFAQFFDLADAVTETIFWLTQFADYASIIAAVNKTAEDQLKAVAASPWNADHYGATAALPMGTLGDRLQQVDDSKIHGFGVLNQYLHVEGDNGNLIASVKFGSNRVNDYFASWHPVDLIKQNGGLHLKIVLK